MKELSAFVDESGDFMELYRTLAGKNDKIALKKMFINDERI